jgi:GDP dissociation inhibitor
MHYLNGAFYPVGGAGSIAQSVEKIVAAQGGKFLLNREVTEILIENDRAVGVNVRQVTAPAESPLETYCAPIIISDTGAVMTYLKLIPADYPISFREPLRPFQRWYLWITCCRRTICPTKWRLDESRNTCAWTLSNWRRPVYGGHRFGNDGRHYDSEPNSRGHFPAASIYHSGKRD